MADKSSQSSWSQRCCRSILVSAQPHTVRSLIIRTTGFQPSAPIVCSRHHKTFILFILKIKLIKSTESFPTADARQYGLAVKEIYICFLSLRQESYQSTGRAGNNCNREFHSCPTASVLGPRNVPGPHPWGVWRRHWYDEVWKAEMIRDLMWFRKGYERLFFFFWG